MNAPIMYFKANPTEYCRISVGGKVKAEEKGASKLILPYRTTVEIVSTSLMNQPYTFLEVTADKQQVTVQGSFLYKAQEPKKVLNNFNCAIDPRTEEDRGSFDEITDQITNSIRGVAKKYIQNASLESMLRQSEELKEDISTKISESKTLSDLGLHVETVYVTLITPEPSIQKALGAEYREKLLTQENQATYDRRAKAVMQERQIKENELNNAIDLEQKRKALIALEETNAKTEGAYKAEVLKMGIDIYKGMSTDELKAHALIALGNNAQNVTALSFSPSLLTTQEK